MLAPRYIPVALLGLLVAIRLFDGDFLGVPVLPSIAWLAWFTWFGLVFTILAYVSAWVLAPGYVAIVNSVARIGLIPPILVFSAIIAGIWALDFTWNAFIDPWCGPCHESHLLASLTAAIGGGGTSKGGT